MPASLRPVSLSLSLLLPPSLCFHTFSARSRLNLETKEKKKSNKGNLHPPQRNALSVIIQSNSEHKELGEGRL